MNYLLLLYAEEGAWPPDQYRLALQESIELCHSLSAEDKYLSAAPLQPPSTAQCVRIRSGQRVLTDGPYAETKEQLGGYFWIDVDSLQEAIEVAARVPGSWRGTAEVRAFETFSKSLTRQNATVSDTASDSAGKAFMLLVYAAEAGRTDAVRESWQARSREFCSELRASGQDVIAFPVLSGPGSTSVRVRDGVRQTSDGAYAATAPELEAIYLFANLSGADHAIALATRVPAAEDGVVEVRPMLALTTLPKTSSTRPALGW